MALDKKTIERLIDKLGDLQRQIESIHHELLTELDREEELSEEEVAEIKAIREEDDYRTLEEWGKAGLGYQLDVSED